MVYLEIRNSSACIKAIKLKVQQLRKLTKQKKKNKKKNMRSQKLKKILEIIPKTLEKQRSTRQLD